MVATRSRCVLSASFALVLLFASCGPLAGGIGESCRARGDCDADLACIDSVCVVAGTASGDRGGVGESCRAREDCAAGLACVANVCVQVGEGDVVTGKQCFAVECGDAADCCQDFVPSPNCPQYEADCNTDPAYCLTYRLLCECNRDCQAELCGDTPPGCASSAECTSFLEPFCVDGHCRECAQHADCPDETDRCVDGRCLAACTLDEHCPLFYGCQGGDCVEVGCTSDLECHFFLGDPRAACGADGSCLVPCVTSLECPEFFVCSGGSCLFAGCNTDEECRVYLGLAEETGSIEAVCR